MSLIQSVHFRREALDHLQQAAEAATQVDGVLGYRILTHPDDRTIVFHLEVENKQVFEALQDHEEAMAASSALWEAHPPTTHTFHQVHSKSS